MALTLEAEQRLQDVRLVEFYTQHQQTWLEAARRTKAFVTNNFPQGSRVRMDDVAKALLPILEVNEVLKDFLDANKLRGKFWIRFFGDLILDRTWAQI